MVNDIKALREPGALEAVAQSQAAVSLMHMQGEPRTMQQAPHYEDVVSEVAEFLARVVFDGIGAAIRRGDLGPGARGVESLRVTLHESHVASAAFDGPFGDA